MGIETDFTIDYANKRINHSSGATRYSVNAFYSWLMDTFDELTQLDDTVPIKANTPTEYEMINGWTLGDGTGTTDATTASYLYGGSLKINRLGDNSNDDLWADIYTIGTLAAGGHVYMDVNGAVAAAPPGYVSGHVDQLVRVRQNGADIDGRQVKVFSRDYGNLYGHFALTTPTTGGRNPVPLATATDLNNTTASATVAAYGVAVAFGATNQDVGDGAGVQAYGVTVDCNGKRLAQVYEALKYLTRQGEVATGTGGTVPGQFYTAVDGSYSEVTAAPYGTFAGGKFFGARGVWLANFDAQDGNSFQLIDSAGVVRTPPTTISVKVDSIVAGDRVFMARTVAGSINKSQFTIASRTATAITVNEAVGADIPSTGALRVGDDRYSYTALNRGTKTFSGMAAVSAYGAGTACYVPLIDEQATAASISKSLVYAADIPVLTRVRKKGILPFEVAGTVTNVGLTTSAIRTTDTVVA